MKDFLNGIVAHLTAGDLSPKTIKPYEGELKDITKITAQYPAVYAYLRPGRPYGVEAEQEARLIVITKSRVYASRTNQTNIDIVDEIGEYIHENFRFSYNGNSYYIDNGSKILVEPLSINQKFSIYAITIKIHQA